MNLDTIRKTVKKFGKDTVSEVQRMNEIRQINSKISNQKKQIVSIYTQIGQKLYSLYKEAPLEGFDLEFRELEDRFAAIDVYADQIREIKGVRICPNCHTEVAVTERYCSACGHKLPEIFRIHEDEDGKVVIEGSEAEAESDAETVEMEAEEAAVETAEAEAEEAAAETVKTVSEEPAVEIVEAEPVEAGAETVETVEAEADDAESEGAGKEQAQGMEDR